MIQKPPHSHAMDAKLRRQGMKPNPGDFVPMVELDF